MLSRIICAKSMFTPDDPDDTSTTSRGTLRLNSVDHRCVRLRAKGLPRSYYDWGVESQRNDDDAPNPTDYQVSEDDKVRFLAVHIAFKDVIEKHGPEIFGVDAADKAVYVEEIEGKSLRDFMFETTWDSPQEVDTAKQVVLNAQDLMSSIERDGFCAPAYASGYVVTPGLTVRQVNFEEIVPILQNRAGCDDSGALEESVHSILRGELTEMYGRDRGYDRAEEILAEMFYGAIV